MQEPERAGISLYPLIWYRKVDEELYIGADLGGCVPDSDYFDIAGYEQLPLALLPV